MLCEKSEKEAELGSVRRSWEKSEGQMELCFIGESKSALIAQFQHKKTEKQN